jgi:hypothetical protein
MLRPRSYMLAAWLVAGCYLLPTSDTHPCDTVETRLYRREEQGHTVYEHATS